MPDLPSPVDLAIPAFVALVLAEIIVARVCARRWYCPRDTLTSPSLGFGSSVAGLLAGGAIFAAAVWVSRFALFDIGWAWWAWPLCFVLDDLAYYCFHRSAHRVRWFCASHVVHHSSLRQTWTGFLSLAFVFRLPLFLIGFEPAMVFFCAGLNLVYQFWIHIEVIGRLPRPVFIVRDRLFGTFEAERDDAPRYGLVHQLGSFNVLWAALHEWAGITGDVWTAPGWRAKLNYMIREPGWSHDGSRETSATIKARWLAQRESAECPTSSTSSSSAGDRREVPSPAD